MSAGTVGSLCTGYGGLDLAVGGELRWLAETDPHAARVCDARFGVPNLGDIQTVDWAAVEPVDTLCAGFPCQDISHAGLGAGIKEGTRSGLWFDVAAAVRVLRPRRVVIENVGALRGRGLDIVTWDLASLGYVGSWVSCRASDIGAPHGRDRVFIVATDTDVTRRQGHEHQLGQPRGSTAADSSDIGRERGGSARRRGGRPEDRREPSSNANGERRGPNERDLRPWQPDLERGAAPDADGRGQQVEPEQRGATVQPRLEASQRNDADRRPHLGRYEPAVRRWEQLTRPAPDPRDDRGRLNPRFVEWMMGLPDGWVCDIVTTRSHSLRILGNGVVPQQARHGIALAEALLERQQVAA